MRQHKRRQRQRLDRQPVRQTWLRRHRYPVLIVVVIVVLFLARVGFVSLLSPDANPMAGKYESLRYGMTAEEVEGILGKANKYDGPETKVWTSGRWGVIIVDFKEGRVSKMHFTPITHHSRPRFP